MIGMSARYFNGRAGNLFFPALYEAALSISNSTLAFSNSSVSYPRDTPVHRVFEAQAAEAPDALALLSPTGPLTYAQLNARANRLAHLLRSRGVQPGAPVALCLERSSSLIVALLAILKAGACYVPLDPAYPASRLRTMAGDSTAHFILTTRSLSASLPAVGTLLLLDEGPCAPGSAFGKPFRRGGRHQPGLHHVHLRLHGPAQGRCHSPPRHCPARARPGVHQACSRRGLSPIRTDLL